MSKVLSLSLKIRSLNLKLYRGVSISREFYPWSFESGLGIEDFNK